MANVYFDIEIGGSPAGRIEFKLYDHILSKLHRVVPGHLRLYVSYQGTGGKSIYSPVFDDENFTLKHDRPFLLTMANHGVNTNSSGFHIITVPTPWLDGKHVVFGEVVSDTQFIRDLEKLGTAQGYPEHTIMIRECGTL
ncbi:peptidyl-prolyl cis-trans isomerase [Aspergillus carlsbadensis]|nr:peptidyl-prolyl cis-trans isomerase [Aspergillus carlsbadensis]